MRPYHIIYICAAVAFCACTADRKSTPAPLSHNDTAVIADTALNTNAKEKRHSEEEAARVFIEQARKLYAEGRYADALARIDTMRRRHPTAIDARKVALLLHDSIKIRDAANHNDGDTREHFYRNKLQHDRKMVSGKK